MATNPPGHGPSGEGPKLKLDVECYSTLKRLHQMESDAHRSSLTWNIPTQSMALVLVDIWNGIYMKSHAERARDITLHRIKPVMEAFRKLGALVVHAPAPSVARKYEKWIPEMSEEDIWGKPSPKPTWPPEEFINKTGAYAEFAKPNVVPNAEYEALYDDLRIMPEVEPQGDDIVIHTGAQLHKILEERKIMWLFYAGFATNVCMINRDYGMRAMQVRGYGVILMRDCTTALEVADTHETLGLTKHIIMNVERKIAVTVTSEQVLKACRATY